jgi:hypothetical protein
VPGFWIRAIALALTAVALLLFVGSLRVQWPHPAYLLMMIAAGAVFALAYRAGGRERKVPVWPLAVSMGLTVAARQIFYEDTAMLSWRSAQHHAALVLSAMIPLLYLMWRSRDRSAAEHEAPPLSPSLPTET